MNKIFTYKVLITILLSLLLSLNMVSQEKYEKPKLENPGSWSMILLPDPQNYVKYGRNQPIFDLMNAWIVENIDSLNIKMVLCTGDLVEQNDRINRSPSAGNQSSQKQWEAVSKSIGKLDGLVPYITAIGNHDYSFDKKGHRSSRFKEFFTIDKNHLNRKIICQNSEDESGAATLENSAYELKSLNGIDYLFLTVEFAPRDTVVTWAKNVVNMEEYKNHRVILLTHGYLSAKSERITGDIKVTSYNPYAINNSIIKRTQKLYDANNAEDIWKKLVEPASNIDMVICGHANGDGYKLDKNKIGKSVHQMMFNAQFIGGGHQGNGGDGWLRILEFLPDGKTVLVKTFSPLFAISPTTQQYAWKKEKNHEFTLRFD